MIRAIAGLANRRSRAMLLRFEAVWADIRPLVWIVCCSPGRFLLLSLQQETSVRFGAVTALAFRYSIGNGTDTDVWTIL
ncbi:hypothetical protein ACH4OQ_37235 [Streptomyces luteogriseus]|uniref:hypothetical protein n=1 Tax=Streptomyces luteogriseus TaxID=68233 RepID=UPI00379807B6